MKVVWLVNIMLPEFARALGQNGLNQGGWLPALVEALRKFAPQVELTIACQGNRIASATIKGVRYVQLIRRNGLGKAVDKLIADVNPDIVHIHGSEGGWSVLPKETFSGCPVVLSLQGVVSGCYPHYCGNLMPSETSSISNLPNMLLTRYWITRRARIWRTRLTCNEQRALGNIDAVLGRTEWDKAWAEFLAPSVKYFHVGEVLREPFYNGGRSDAAVVPRTIFCGAAFGYPLKGGHWLLRAVSALTRKYPDVELRIANAQKVETPKNLLAFMRQGEYHRYLSRLIKRLGIERNVVLLPSLTADDVAAELRRAEVFCLPSLCENSPNSLGEAMLMMCPCIATDVGGIQTILKNGEQGVLVPSGDPAILAHEISRLFEDKTLAKKYAIAGHNDAVLRYSPKTVVGELLTAYGQVVRR